MVFSTPSMKKDSPAPGGIRITVLGSIGIVVFKDGSFISASLWT